MVLPTPQDHLGKQSALNNLEVEMRLQLSGGPVGPLRGSANKGQRAQETQSQGEEQQEAQLRVVGSDNRRCPVSKEHSHYYNGKTGTTNRECSQDDSQDLVKGKKLHRLGDTSVSLCVGPGLLVARKTIRGIWRKKKIKNMLQSRQICATVDMH